MNDKNNNELLKSIQKQQPLIKDVFQEMSKVVIGQKYLIETLFIGLLADGHILIEGLPGLAKTLTIKTFASLLKADFSRIQFTSDMLPADLTGTIIFDHNTSQYTTWKGPIFTNILLADEINRAPAKAQGALLEVMEEKQITIGENTYKLDPPFFVLATQNPMDQSGTYSLPESQLDRFMLNVRITYPNRTEEKKILRNNSITNKTSELKEILDPSKILDMRKLVNQIHVSENVEDYILNIVECTRTCEKFNFMNLSGMIEFGVSPRATIHLTIASKAYAFLQGREYVTPQDVKYIALDVLKHRIIISHKAISQGLTNKDIMHKILNHIEMP